MRALALAALAAAVLLPSAALAATPDAFAKSLDRPLATKVVKAKGDVSEITCTWYADSMIRESGTDSPDPDNATLVPIAKGAARPACSATPPAGAITLKTEGYGLEGRRAGFLIWDASDPNGGASFLVLDAKSGKQLFEDAISPTLGLRRSATLQNGVLRLQYTRGYNANCSLVKDAKGCWASLIASGAVPRTMPALTAAPASCLAAYRKTPKDDPSVITYTVDMTLDAAGQATLKSTGAVSCQPMP